MTDVTVGNGGEDTWQQLMVLRGMTQTTGILHDAQIFQLKMWSMVFSPHVQSCELRIGPEKREIEFHLKTKGKAPGDFKDRCQMLVQWVQNLLGPEWLVRIKAKDKLLHRGMRKVVSNERGQAGPRDGEAK